MLFTTQMHLNLFCGPPKVSIAYIHLGPRASSRPSSASESSYNIFPPATQILQSYPSNQTQYETGDHLTMIEHKTEARYSAIRISEVSISKGTLLSIINTIVYFCFVLTDKIGGKRDCCHFSVQQRPQNWGGGILWVVATTSLYWPRNFGKFSLKK